jgi:hypothetical protein
MGGRVSNKRDVGAKRARIAGRWQTLLSWALLCAILAAAAAVMFGRSLVGSVGGRASLDTRSTVADSHDAGTALRASAARQPGTESHASRSFSGTEPLLLLLLGSVLLCASAGVSIFVSRAGASSTRVDAGGTR